MTLMIELSPAEEARLDEAARQTGLDPISLTRQALNAHLPTLLNQSKDPTLALFAQWEQEDAQMTPDETAQERRVWEQFEIGVNKNREELGMRRL